MARKRPDVGRKAGDGSYCSGKNKELQSGTAVAACAAGGTAEKCALLQAAKRDERVVTNSIKLDQISKMNKRARDLQHSC